MAFRIVPTLLPLRVPTYPPARNPNPPHPHLSPPLLLFVESVPRLPTFLPSPRFQWSRRSTIQCSAADEPSPSADDRKAETTSVAKSQGARILEKVKHYAHKKPRLKSVCSYKLFHSFFVRCDKETQDAFLETPFKHFASSTFPSRDHRFYCDLLMLYDSTDQTFAIGGKKLQFTVDDVVNITGLSKEGREILLNTGSREETAFRIKHFPMKRHTISNAYVALQNLNTGDIDDKLRLLLLIFFGSFLFAYANMYIKPALFKCVEDLSTLGSYAWAKAVHLSVHDELKKVHAKMNERRNLGYLNGCCSLLSVWAFEKINLIDPVDPKGFPLIKRWPFGTKYSVSSLLQLNRVTLLTVSDDMIRCNKLTVSSRDATMDKGHQTLSLECSEVASIRNEGQEQSIASHDCQELCGEYCNGTSKMEITSILRQVEQFEAQLISLMESSKALTAEIMALKMKMLEYKGRTPS